MLVGSDGRSLLDATARRGSRLVFGADPEAPVAGGRDGIAPHIWARVGRPAATPQSVPLDAAVAAALRTGGPLAGHAVWTAADFLAGLDTHLPQGCSTAGMLGAAAALERRGEVVALGTSSSRHDGAGDPDGTGHDLAGEHTVDPMAHFALTSVVADEEAVLASCARPHPGLLSARAIRRAIRRTERTHGVQLSGEQRRAAAEVLTDGRAVSAITGVPGAGKTSVLAAIAEGFSEAGYEVTGLAHTGVASQTLGRQARIASSTIDSFLFRLSHGFTRIGVRSVVICDEASQVDTARMRALVAETEAAGAKLVLVGDPHQQGSVEAGGLFAEIVWRHGSAVLSKNRRQRQAHEAEAVAALRQGDAAEAVAAYCDHDQVRVTRTHAEMLQGAVDEYTAHRVNGSEAVLIAQRRTDVAALNVVARSCLVHAGLVDDACGATLQGEVPVRVAAGDSLRMTSRLQVVLVRLARRTKIGDVVFDKGEVVTAHLDGPVVTITSPSRVATANRYFLPRPRRLREKELARCRASGVSPATLVALCGLGSLRGAKSLRRGSRVEVTDVAGGVVSLRAQELEIVLACRALCGAVEHAYAFSAATAQSQTIGSTCRAGHAVVVSADELGREEALVALTRARDGTTLWACVEDQATATWTRKRTEAAEALLGAIARLGQRDPDVAAFLSLVTGADANPLDARTAGAALGLDAEETGKLARRVTAALRSPGIGDALAIPGPSRAETSARDIVVAARRVFAERAQDPLVRMAQRWGTGATREHAASTEMRRRAEAQEPTRAMHGQDEAARVAVSAFVHAATSADVTARSIADDAGGQDHAGHPVSPTSDRAFTVVPVSETAAAAEMASRRPVPSARAGAGRPMPGAMAGARDGNRECQGRGAAYAPARSEPKRHSLSAFK